jgi:elongation factor Ts
MAEITANDVKVLRERTGAGMMDCKKALVECEGNIENAIDFLRKKGLAAAAKKAGRIAADGLIGVCVHGNRGTLLEVNTETDFVARNETFHAYVHRTSEIANDKECNIEALKNEAYPETGRTVAEELVYLISIIGENMDLRRVSHLSVSEGVVVSYVHNKISANLGKVGVIVGLESAGNKDKLLEFGKKIAMHIAATNPHAVSIEDVDPTVLAREREIVSEQAKSTGKPAEFIEKIAEGRIRKFYEEIVLSEQVFVIDGSAKVKDVVAAAAQDIGAPVTIKGFVKFVLGEGIEKPEVDFAAEVAAQLT